nr:hypothetical protein [Tanacetum cinerariifolium]
MSFQRSKEDHVDHISISIFVTNFLDDVGPSDLWKVYEGYGKVVDVFTPNRDLKPFHLHATVVRFERASKHVSLVSITRANMHGKVGSYATAVRGKTPLNVHVTPVSFTPTLVLDEACAITRDLSRHVMGKVKDINSISNLRTLLAKEGFPKAKLTFLGGLWDASHDFVSDERVVWVDLEGVPLNLWSCETFLKIGNKWGEALDIKDNSGFSFARKHLCVITKQLDFILEKFKEMVYTSDGESVHGENKQPGGLQLSDEESNGDSDVDGVPDTVFGENSFSHHAPRGESDNQQSDDPFGFYDLLKKQRVEDKRG